MRWRLSLEKSKFGAMNAKSVLKQYFGYDRFREHQEQAIEAFLSGRDVFVLMPTGGGKSLCYQIPALMSSGLVVVVSPLIALMKDQVDALKAYGVEAEFINSTMSPHEQRMIMERAAEGKIKLLYIAPERFKVQGDTFLQFLDKANVSGFAVDEAHCISHWGHDFRPDYLELASLKERFPKIPVMALTASADKATRSDITDKLKLIKPEVFISSFNRGNIRYDIRHSADEFSELIDFLNLHKGDSGIIYTLKRTDTESLAAELTDAGFKAIPYHAGLDNITRAKHQELFLRDEAPIVVATIAFGMGIDKSNVRFVVHMNMPKNIESYYQETGRAGRDGLPSTALLFFNRGDVGTLSYFAKIEDNEQQSRIMLDKLYQMADFCQTSTCRRKYMLNYFDEDYDDYCGNCDVCLSGYELQNVTVEAQKALSAVARLNEQFGVNMVVDFLRGSQSKKITPWMRNIRTYGVGNDVSRVEWIELMNRFIEVGLLERSGGKLPVLNLTAKAWKVLKNGQKVELKIKKEDPAVQRAKQEEKYDPKLFNLLKEQRKLIADKDNVPAYIILSDISLVQMSRYYPMSPVDLEKIGGFGKIKIAKYGSAFLDVIQDYCRKKGIKSQMHKISNRKKKVGVRRKNKYGKTVSSAVSYELFRKGRSVSQIAEIRNLAESTIFSHLEAYVRDKAIKPDELIDGNKVDKIKSECMNNPDLKLSELKQLLGEGYSYEDIKVVKAAMEL